MLLDYGSSVAWLLKIPLWCGGGWLQRCTIPWSSLFGTSPSHAIHLRKKKNRNFLKSCLLSGLHVLCQSFLLCCFLLFSVQAWGRGSCLHVGDKANPEALLADYFWLILLPGAVSGLCWLPGASRWRFSLPFPDLLWRLRNMWKDHVKAMLSGIVFTSI